MRLGVGEPPGSRVTTHRMAQAFEPAGEALDLGRLPGPLPAFEGDEAPAHQRAVG